MYEADVWAELFGKYVSNCSFLTDSQTEAGRMKADENIVNLSLCFNVALMFTIFTTRHASLFFAISVIAFEVRERNP